jgi:phosphinothricin acetyltransferase
MSTKIIMEKIGKLLTELIQLAKNQKLHTMIAVIDAENQSSIGFMKNLVLKL